MDLSTLIQDITASKGWISGSYVRDVLIRKDPSYVIHDVDVLIPFSLHKMLVRILLRKYHFAERVLDYNVTEQIAHTELHSGDMIVDIFSSEGYEYLSPPDFDVNTLCWTGQGYTSWFPDVEAQEEIYGYPFDVESILQRTLRKEAIAMTEEWIIPDDDGVMTERFYKLVGKGWTILNYQNAANLLTS